MSARQLRIQLVLPSQTTAAQMCHTIHKPKDVLLFGAERLSTGHHDRGAAAHAFCTTDSSHRSDNHCRYISHCNVFISGPHTRPHTRPKPSKRTAASPAAPGGSASQSSYLPAPHSAHQPHAVSSCWCLSKQNGVSYIFKKGVNVPEPFTAIEDSQLSSCFPSDTTMAASSCGCT